MIHLVLLAAAATAPHLAIDDAVYERSAAQIVCTLTGDCGGSAGGLRARRPKEAAFEVDGIADRSIEAQFVKVRAARARAAAAAGSR